MLTNTPLMILAIAALAGAALMAFFFRKRPKVLPTALVAGGLAGAIGSLIFMGPLDFCTFEPERSSLDVGFGVFLIAVGVIGIALPVRWVLNRLFDRTPIFTQQTQQGAFKGWLMPIMLLTPTIIILALFLYYPSLETFTLSTQLARLGARRSIFICVDNFTSLLTDPVYGQVVITTFFMSVAIVVIGLALSLLIATMAYQPIRGASIYRTLLIWPYAISPVVAGVIFLLLFNPTGGIINFFLNSTFGFGVPWLTNPTYAPWAVIIASVWKSMGFNILFYIAGLQNVPKDLLEAASIDGANALKRFRHVVLPMLSPITFFLIITNMTYAFFDTFGTIDALTGGGPLRSTTTMMYNIYQIGILNNDLGKAAAQSIVLFAMVIGLTYLQFRTTARQVTYGA
ncbi:MAG: sugar ABC transporter permease [Aggregatilineales bacterium]